MSYDCLNCPGYCCSYPVIALSKRDVERIAKHHDMSYAQAEAKLQECLRDFSEVAVIPDTLINLIVCNVHTGSASKMPAIQGYVGQMQAQFPSHPFLAGLDRVTSAFDRESIKYKV